MMATDLLWNDGLEGMILSSEFGINRVKTLSTAFHIWHPHKVRGMDHQIELPQAAVDMNDGSLAGGMTKM